jgi:ABC-2 type transport system ATP-binding protein
MKIEVVGLKRSFETTQAVRGVSFSFEGGQIVGFVGPNGAGKTTTMRIISTLDEPTEGDVLIDGVSVVEEPERARKLVGYVPDALPAHRDISVHDYLDFFARAYGIKEPRRSETLESVEAFTNLLGIREKTLNALSKGMKQRVSLARALLHDPMVLVMDEPAAGLDPRARIELRELLRILSSQGKAILISSHILTELSEMCNAAVIIEQGQVLMSGPISSLLNESVTRRVVTMRTMERLEDLHRELLQTPNIESARIVGNEIEVDIAGNEEMAALLLIHLVQRGHRLVEFRQQRANLEELFMSVTRGEVQ